MSMALRFLLKCSVSSIAPRSCCTLSSRCRRLLFHAPSSSPAPPPSPKKFPFTVSVHGKTWQDPYHWMSNTEDPDLLHHLNYENTYAEAFMADTINLQSTLSSEMTSRIPASISTPPERWGPWLVHTLFHFSCLLH